jgi:hypothetical protein
MITKNSWNDPGERSELWHEFPFANRQGNYGSVNSSQNKPIMDEVRYCFWMRLDAVRGGWHFLLCDTRGFSRSSQKRIKGRAMRLPMFAI